jgi:uncharacterized protein YbjT (DUF2867 family)
MAFVLSSPDPILVLGGTGKVGKRVANQLASAAVPTLAASRSGETPGPASKYLQGVKFDWFDKATWENPWKAASPHNVRAVYIIAPPILDSAPIMVEFVEFALSKGTRRFVLQSGTPIEAGDEWGMGQLHYYVRCLGNEGRCDWAVLRPTWFMGTISEADFPRIGRARLTLAPENFTEVESHVKSIKEEGKIYSATDRGILPFVSADDIAACAAVLLTQVQPPHTEYMILGPRNLSYHDV